MLPARVASLWGGGLVERPTERPGGSERVRIELGNKGERGSSCAGFIAERFSSVGRKASANTVQKCKSGGIRRTPDASRVRQRADCGEAFGVRGIPALWDHAPPVDRTAKPVRRLGQALVRMCCIHQSGHSSSHQSSLGSSSAIFGSTFANVG